jgi:hypothetical protein
MHQSHSHKAEKFSALCLRYDLECVVSFRGKIRRRCHQAERVDGVSAMRFADGWTN